MLGAGESGNERRGRGGIQERLLTAAGGRSFCMTCAYVIHDSEPEED